MDRQPVLIGERATVQPTTAGEYDALYRVASDPAIWEQHPAHDRWQPDVFRAFFDAGLASGGMLTIRDAADGRVIGSSRYGPVGDDMVEIGWTFLARSHWRRGHNREVKRLMIGHALARVAAVRFTVGADNRRSRTAVAALGAIALPDRVMRTMGGRDVEHVIYELRRA